MTSLSPRGIRSRRGRLRPAGLAPLQPRRPPNRPAPGWRIDICTYIYHNAPVERVIAGFDWDAGNRAKCLEHGVSTAEVEAMFQRPIMVLPDAAHSGSERRFKAIGTTAAGRHVFLVFTTRIRQRRQYIRPISARYMHAKEVQHYEEENPQV